MTGGIELRVSEECRSPRSRDFKLSRNKSQRAVINNILNAIALQLNGHQNDAVSCHAAAAEQETSAGGPTRLKIRVKKEDLKQVLEVIRSSDGRAADVQRQSSAAAAAAAMSLEQRLNLMRKRHFVRANQMKVRNRGSWRPVLQSIPEEI